MGVASLATIQRTVSEMKQPCSASEQPNPVPISYSNVETSLNIRKCKLTQAEARLADVQQVDYYLENIQVPMELIEYFFIESTPNNLTDERKYNFIAEYWLT